MAKLISRGDENGFTILPFSLDTPIQTELIENPSDYVLGYVTYNKESGERKFSYTESGCVTETNNHWSLTILKEFPYCENDGPWVVYSCSPENTSLEFGKIIGKYGESLHIHNWDTWAIEGKNSNVVVVTSWEMF